MLFELAVRAVDAVRYFRTALHDDRGATAVEYGLMVALIAAVIAAVVALLGDEVAEIFRDYIASTPF